MRTDQVIAEFEKLRVALLHGPVNLVGASVVVDVGRGGSVTGLSVVVSGAGPGTHSVGLSVTVNVEKYQKEAGALAREIEEFLRVSRTSGPPTTWATTLIDKAKALGNRALDGIIGAAAATLVGL